MAINWDKFDKMVDFDGIQNKVEEAAEMGDFPEIPLGKYEVKVDSMELGQSKKKEDGSGGDPMLKITFEILDGEFKGYKLFYNGVMQPGNERAIGYQVHSNNEMLRSLIDSDDVSFKNFSQYAEEIDAIAEEIIEDGWEYIIEKSLTNKGYDKYEILEVLD
ncbi:DUF669 domain-containing protein [Facklamia sp. 7083-14-GEN3]|uniref:DUF669 domain-containing protein n=1 Tax=Facklamia sp. 7083-14-GEN3 TaxID=2973478 RepID=UPI00215BFB15|nr:DUF669 domain-containing protein [Facklamia sp. 7083-14-GEN3]MCR8969293.1 DUF669 domain-containing protein [Facklamia sp. 7083-14-GEN3]